MAATAEVHALDSRPYDIEDPESSELGKGEVLVPYDQCERWRMHDAYFATRGIGAWLDGEIPHRATNNQAFAGQHAAILVALADALEAEGRLGAGEGVQILEIGVGLGDFAANLLRALQHDLGDAGRALFSRLTYVCSDVSRTSLSQAIERPELRALVASGRVVPVLFDAREPSSARTLDGEPFAISPLAMIANYICCVLPAKVLRKEDDAWHELYARLDLGSSGGRLADPTEGAVDRWQLFVGDHEWRRVDLCAVFDSPVHPTVLERVLEGPREAEIAYPYAFIDLLGAVEARMRPGGVVLFSDFADRSCDERIGPESRVPVLYRDTLNHAVCFPVFEAVAEVRGRALLDSRGRHGVTRTMVLCEAPVSDAVRGVFESGFLRHNKGQDQLDFEAMARKLFELGEHGHAVRFYDRCLALDRHDPELFQRAGDACMADGKYSIGLGYYLEGAAVDRRGAYDFDFRIGEAYFRMGEPGPALEHLEESLRGGETPLKRMALGDVFRSLADYDRAFREYRRALSLDPTFSLAELRIEDLKPVWCDAELGLSAMVERWWAEKLETPPAERA